MSGEILKAVTDIIFDKDDVWIISDEWNCLFRYNLPEKNLELETVFPKAPGTDYGAFSKILKLKNEIYFIPFKAKNIFYYNLIKKEMHAMDISIQLPEVKNMGAVVQGKYIYCINRFPDAVIKIDTVTKKATVFKADIDRYIDTDIEEKVYRTYKEPCIDNGKIYWSNYSDMLIIFDTENQSFSIEFLDGLPQGGVERLENAYGMELKDWIIGVRVFKGIIFLFSMEGRVYQYKDAIYEIKDNLFNGYINCSDIDNITCAVFYDLIELGSNLYFISSYKNKCIKYNNVSKRFEEVLYSYRETWNGNRRSYSLCKAIDEQKIVLYSYYESCFYILDFENDLTEKIYLQFPMIDRKWTKRNLVLANLLLKRIENKDNLKILLIRMLYENQEQEQTLSADEIVGEKIYKALN